MYREIMNELILWKDRNNRKPLLVSGVRQCGKTYIIKEFGNNCFDNLAYLNFEESDNAAAIFDYDFDVNRIIREIEYHTKANIIAGKTLLFFDEIQNCPRAITALKYFSENMPDLHVVCAGSLLGVAIKREKISFPVGKINRLRLYPMSFVGGMPEAVKVWLDSHDYEEVSNVQSEILNDYADDFSKYAPISDVPKIRWIWESIPVQLAKENNKFVFSHVKAGKRSAELEDALQWLKDAGLIYQLHLVEKPELPLSGFADETYFKVYMSDIGLLRTKSGLSAKIIQDEAALYMRYKGAFAENYVMNELLSVGKEPYFWRSGNTAEVDFIYEDRSSVIPVEVKAADNTQAKSYKQFCKKYQPKFGLKLSEKNLAENMCEETRTLSLPLYLAWNIDNYC